MIYLSACVHMCSRNWWTIVTLEVRIIENWRTRILSSDEVQYGKKRLKCLAGFRWAQSTLDIK